MFVQYPHIGVNCNPGSLNNFHCPVLKPGYSYLDSTAILYYIHSHTAWALISLVSFALIFQKILQIDWKYT